SYHGFVDTKTAKEPESDKPSSQSARSTSQQSGVRRTLFFAGVFALLAMVFVPTPRQGYRWIFDTSDTSVAFFQLLANVAFAALAGAIVANLPKRAFFVIGVCIAVVAVGAGVLALKREIENATSFADSEERYANRLLQWKESPYGQMDRVHLAEDSLRSARSYWRRAWRFDQAKRVEQRANEVA